ncbi:hypothetical protein ACHQM5_003127 [Ranunculus cassubicifolius]
MALLLFMTTFLQLLFLKCESTAPLAPALYVFGDSLSDSGNNNGLRTLARADHEPYGVDFPSGATGRFTNGKTMVDFIAESLGLPFAPPYLSTEDKSCFKAGVNYASGSAGILPETGSALGENVDFNKQITYFQETSKDQDELARSIFVVWIGSNDYLNNYLQPQSYNSSHQYNPIQFADRLTNTLRQGIERLYELGARKFAVFNIARIGCIPATVALANQRPPAPCVEDVNNLVLIFNTMLLPVIAELENTLTGSTFVRGDVYGIGKTSQETGVSEAQSYCCQVDFTGMCAANLAPCENRSMHLFFDSFHPSEVASNRMASECFDGYSSCMPMNIRQLAQK